MIIGLTGKAGSGKDSIAEMIAPTHLVEMDGTFKDVRGLLAPKKKNGTKHHEPLRIHSTQIALADPLKEYCMRIYDFSVEQLWGPSEKRNAPDMRYKRVNDKHLLVQTKGFLVFVCERCGRVVEGKIGTTKEGTAEVTPPDIDEQCETYLTPREALQKLGTEWGRAMWEDTWIHHGLHRAKDLLQRSRLKHPEKGSAFVGSWLIESTELVVISDVRFKNEIDAIHAVGGEVWLVQREGAGLKGAAGKHTSETEQEGLTDLVDWTIQNDDSLDALYATVSSALSEAGL